MMDAISTHCQKAYWAPEAIPPRDVQTSFICYIRKETAITSTARETIGTLVLNLFCQINKLDQCNESIGKREDKEDKRKK